MILAFNKWSAEGIQVEDPGLEKYIGITPKLVPKTGARYAKNRFHKSKVFIVERLINKLMVPGHKGKEHFRSSGHCTGKASRAYKTVVNMLKQLEEKTNKNPIKVFIKALENSAPREEIVNIEYGGARYPKAVDCSPQRRIDVTLRFFVQGAYEKSFNKKTLIEKALANEILSAYKSDPDSHAIRKKKDIERQADSNR